MDRHSLEVSVLVSASSWTSLYPDIPHQLQCHPRSQLTPTGSVSSAAWATVIKRVLSTLEEIVKDLLAPSPTTGVNPMAEFPAQSGESVSASASY